jgi:hypothetical protein
MFLGLQDPDPFSSISLCVALINSRDTKWRKQSKKVLLYPRANLIVSRISCTDRNGWKSKKVFSSFCEQIVFFVKTHNVN